MKKIIIITCLLFAVSCNKDTAVSGMATTGSETTPTPTPTPTPGTLTTVNRVVSYGQSRTNNNRTSGMNDMELNPVTNQPAIAYYDRDQRGSTSPTTIGALKYAEMDANGQWNIEIIDVNYASVLAGGACGVINTFCIGVPNIANTGGIAQVINLAFKTDGTPVIAYVFGASLNTVGDREIRLAERSISGVWTVSRAFSINNGGAPTEPSQAPAINSMTGVTLLIDSANRPHITFALYTTLITSSKIKYLFRDLSGTWTSSDIMNAVGASGTITAVTQGSMQAGAAWCSAGTNSSTPTAQMGVYGYQVLTGAAGFGHPVYINCTAVNTSGACTAWNSIDLVSQCAANTCATPFVLATTNAGHRMDISIEPSTNRPVIGLYSVAIPNTQLGTIYAPSACNVAQTTTLNSWGNMSNIEVAGVNQHGLKVHALDTSNWVMAFNVGVASTRVMRSTSGQLGWAALAGHIIESSTVGAEGIGSAFDAINNQLYVSWGSGSGSIVSGAALNDLKIGSIDYADIANGTAAGLFNIEVIDNTGTVFPNPTVTTGLPLMSAAKAANGQVGFSYFYVDFTVGEMKLYYGVRYNTDAAPLFMETQVVNFQESVTSIQGVGLNPSLSYDSNSNPVIAFYNGVVADQNLVVARSMNGNNFTYSVVDETSADVGKYSSSATYGTAIGVAYKDSTNSSVKFARWTPADKWRRFTIDGNAGSTGAGCSTTNTSGDYSKLVFTSTGRPVVVYQDDTAVPAVLRIAAATETVTSNTFTWTCLTLDTTGNAAPFGRAEGVDVALDSSDRVHITHYDAAAGTIRYVSSARPVLEALAAGTSDFSESIVATVGSTIITQSGFNVPSIQVSSEGTVYISYHDKNNVRFALASKASTASTFTSETIEASPLGGNVMSAIGAYGDMLLNESEEPMLFFGSFGGYIKYFTREYL